MQKRKVIKSRKTKGKWLGIGGSSSNVVEGEVVREIPKGEKRKKEPGQEAFQKLLKKERQERESERKRQATILKFQRKAEVEEAKGRFLKATAAKRAYRRKATRLHPLGIISGVGGRVIGGGMKKIRKSKKKIGW